MSHILVLSIKLATVNSISYFEVSTVIIVPTDICHWWCKLNFEPSDGSGELQDKTYKQQVYFRSCLTLLTSAVSHEVKSSNYISMLKFQSSNLLQQALLKSHLAVQICTVTMLNNSNITAQFCSEKNRIKLNSISSQKIITKSKHTFLIKSILPQHQHYILLKYFAT